MGGLLVTCEENSQAVPWPYRRWGQVKGRCVLWLWCAGNNIIIFSDVSLQKELRDLLRKGIPIEYRVIVWTRYVTSCVCLWSSLCHMIITWLSHVHSLVFQHVGRLKELRDLAAEGGSYYWSLVHCKSKVSHACNLAPPTSGDRVICLSCDCMQILQSPLEKQIKIDLHRTLPNNRHFKLNGSGVRRQYWSPPTNPYNAPSSLPIDFQAGEHSDGL